MNDRIVMDAPAGSDHAAPPAPSGAASGGGLPEFGASQRADFDNSPRPMRIIDPAALRYLAVNDAALRLYGYSRAEFLRLTLKDTRHPEEHADQLASLSRREGYFMHRGPLRHVKKSGEVFLAEVVSQDVLFEGRRARVGLTIDLTERTKALALVRQREREFEALAEHLPDLVARFDPDGRYVYVNSAVEQLAGVSREALIGRTQRELGMPDEIVALFEESFRVAVCTGQAHMLEFAYPKPSGERLFEAYHVPERDASSVVRTILCIARDITGRKKVEDEARRQKNLFAAVIDNLPMGVFIRDAQTLRYVLRNRHCENANGYPVRDSAGLTPYDLFPKEQADLTVATDREALATGRMVEIAEQEMIGRSGEPRIFHVRKVPVFAENGRPWMVVGIADDITERRRAQRTLRDSEARLELAVEGTGLGMWDWDVRTGAVWRHPLWARVLGYEPGEVAPHICMWKELCHPEDYPKTQEALLEHFEGRTPVYRADYRMRHKDGSWVWIGCRASVIERETDGTPRRMIGYIRNISDRRTMEEALRESQQQFRAVTETANEAIVSADSRGNIIYFNQSAARLFGYCVEEAIGEPLTALMPERYKGAHERGFGAILAGSASSILGRTLEVVGRRKDGTEFPLELSLARWTTAAGTFFTGIMRDLSARKRRQSLESTLAAIVNNSADAIISKDLDGIVRTWNPGAERLFGYRADEIVGQSITMLTPPEQRDGEALILERIRRGGRVEAFESVRCKKGGERVDVSLTVSPVKDAVGLVVGASTIVRDITAAKRAENALRESEERFRQLAENIKEVFWINTPPGDELVYVSPGYEEIWGRTCESLYRSPRTWMEPIHPEDLPAVRAAQARMPNGEETDVEYRIVRPDGTLRWIRDRSYPMRRGDGTTFTCGIAEDITSRKRGEEERVTHALQQRDALVREVHHRIKNHLQGIAGLLRNKAGEDAGAARTIEAAVAQLQSVAVVYGLQSELAESGVPLREMLEAICSSAEGLSSARVKRRLPAAGGRLRLAETEAVPVAVALNELVFNAIEHGKRRAGSPAVEIALTESPGAAEIRIVNRGKLPARFDYERGIATGTGLELVRTLLGPAGSELAYRSGGGQVDVSLKLREPLVAVRKRVSRRRSRA